MKNRVDTLSAILKANAKKGKKKGNVNSTKCEWNSLKFASITEKNKYIEFDAFQKAGKIINLHQSKTVVLMEMGKFIKNGKVSKVENLKYTADFSFYALALKYNQHVIIGKNVIVEVKSIATAKKTDYIMRRKMFLNTLKQDDVFLEIVVGKRIKTTLWEVK